MRSLCMATREWLQIIKLKVFFKKRLALMLSALPTVYKNKQNCYQQKYSWAGGDTNELVFALPSHYPLGDYGQTLCLSCSLLSRGLPLYTGDSPPPQMKHSLSTDAKQPFLNYDRGKYTTRVVHDQDVCPSISQ